MTSKIQDNVNLKPYSTMAIDVKTKHYLPINTEKDLTQCLQQDLAAMPFFILGGGSNVVFCQNFPGLVLHNKLQGIKVIKEDDQSALIKVASGVNWNDFVNYSVDNHLGGIENLALIPGTVGAAPIQNIGAYGVEVKSTIETVEAISLLDGKRRCFSNFECQFAYRDSIFKRDLKDQFFITHVTFKLSKLPHLNFHYESLKNSLLEMNIEKLSIKVIRDVVTKIRQSKLPNPKEIPNTGSFFKNPIIKLSKLNELLKYHPNMPFFPTDKPEQKKVSAAWLIEQAGFKGKQFGNVGIYAKQALVIVNHGNGKGSEILALVENIQKLVYEKFTIQLVPEVQLV